MRRLLLALPFALLPLTSAHAEEDPHASLGAHEHGAAQLNVALDGNHLELALESPAMNLLGFEHAASSASDQARVTQARRQLDDPQALFGIPPAAGCTVDRHDVRSPLFAEPDPAAAPSDEHNDVDADYALSCKQPGELKTIDLSELFRRFPGMQKIQLQLIGPNGQQGAELSPSNPRLAF